MESEAFGRNEAEQRLAKGSRLLLLSMLSQKIEPHIWHWRVIVTCLLA